MPVYVHSLTTPWEEGGGGGSIEGYFSNLFSANIQHKLLWRVLVCYNLTQSIPAANVFLIDWCFHFVWLLWSTCGHQAKDSYKKRDVPHN